MNSYHTERSTSDVIERLAEHRIGWDEVRSRLAEAIAIARPDQDPASHLGDFVTVSEQPGTGGRALAQRLADALGWQVADHELVDLVAAQLGTEGTALELLDEEQSNWVRDVLGDFLPGEVINRDSYVSHLGKVVKLLAMRGRIVLVGHGAPCFLPRDRGLRLRIVAPLEDRTRRFAREQGVGEDQARARIAELERSHAAFVSHYFGQDVSSPEMYDLILNSRVLTLEELFRVALAGVQQAGMDIHSQPPATGRV